MKWCISLAASLVAGTATAQSVNLDFGSDAGSPPPAYAAAGLAGVWNALDDAAGMPQALVDLSGRPIAATVTHDLSVTIAIDDPATGGDDERFLDDGLAGVGDVQMTALFQGLVNGTYEVSTYGWTPDTPDDETLVIIDDEPKEGLVAGGTWPGNFKPGVTHVVHEATVTDGTLAIGVVGGHWGATGFLNGIQLRRITAADLDQDGTVGIADFLALLGAWGDCPDSSACAADLDGNGAVDINDFLMLLGDWG